MEYILPKSWNKVIQNVNKTNIIDDEFIKLIFNEYNNNIVYPKIENIFKCFEYFDLNETKIVILGQDPYYTPDIAHGLAFGIDNNINKIPPSLKNIAKELYNDVSINLQDYTLENWAKQKILLLNTSLTVIKNKPGSHIKYWNKFIDYIINELNKLDNIIFVAWGKHAHDKLKNINTNKHYLIISSHPSPLSCYKTYKTYPTFNNSKPFTQINNILKKNNEKQIIW